MLPAHDYNLKCSHLFNVLDTRGAIGVTERANYFRRMRRVARQVADLYVEQRMRLEYPLLNELDESQEQPVEAAAAICPKRNARMPYCWKLAAKNCPLTIWNRRCDNCTRWYRKCWMTCA